MAGKAFHWYRPLIYDEFGYTSVGGTAYGVSSHYIRGDVYTGVAGTGTSMSAAVINEGDAFRIGLYKESDDSFIKGTVEGSALAVKDFIPLNFTDNPTLEAIDYVLCVYAGVGVSLWGDAATGWPDRVVYAAYPTWPGSPSFADYTGYKYSIYCTYTPVGVAFIPKFVGVI
ncbi:hypothetical protein ES703_125379 [subsurface metagenome]